MELLVTHMAQSLVVLGLLLLVIEVAVLGFSTFVLFFMGLAAITAGGLMYVDVVDETMLNAALSVSLLTLLYALVLWKPLKNMQGQVERNHPQSDLIGYRFRLQQDVLPDTPGQYRYSGIEWQVCSATPLKQGEEVEVVAVDVGRWKVQGV